MAILDFPPLSNGATYTQNEIDYLYDGTKWVASLGPTSGTQIATPSIISPINGATNINPNVDLNITSSAFAAVSGNPGNHASTSWTITEGVQPRVSTNMITDSLGSDATYTARATWDCGQVATNGIDGSRMRGIQNVVRTVAVGGTPSRLWACVWNGGASNYQGRCNVFFSEDDGITWTDDSARFNVGLNNMNWSAGGYQPVGQFGYWGYSTVGPMIPLADGTGWTLICNGNCMNPSSTITAGVRYEAQTDTYTNFGATACGVNTVWAYGGWLGQIHDTTTEQATNRWVFGDTSGNFGKSILDVETMTSMSIGSQSNLSTLGAFTNNGEIYFGRGGNGKAGDYSPTAWFTCPITSDVTDPTNRTELVNQQAEGESWGSAFYQIHWWDAGNIFIMLGRTGVIMTYNPSENLFQQHRLAITDDVEAYFFDGTKHWFITDRQRIVTTTNFESFFYDTISDAIGQSSSPIFYDDVSGNYISTVQPVDQDTVIIATSTQPTDGVSIDIVGAQTDGFQVSEQIENRGGLEASGIINTINDTQAVLVNVQGTWSAPATDGEDPSQRISIPVENFNTIIDDRKDTENLTTFTLQKNLLKTNSEYRLSIQYRSDSNVVSDTSDWYSFQTGE